VVFWLLAEQLRRGGLMAATGSDID